VPPRKKRIRVVFDTNVMLRWELRRTSTSANARVYLLWRDERRVQLVVSDELEQEYVEIFERLGVGPERLARLVGRLETSGTVTRVSLGKRFADCRDPDDNLLLATAAAGEARFLVTNDQDLLEIDAERQKAYPFTIVTPAELLARLED
jgi:putative PIN family toxin of toxin-antitoxin system